MGIKIRKSKIILFSPGCCIRALGAISCLFSLMLGVCSFVVCVVAIYTHGEVSRTLDLDLYYGMYIFLFASLCISWIAFLGMCGMATKNRFFIFVLMLGSIIFVVTLLVGIWIVLNFSSSTMDSVRDLMLRSMKEKYGNFALVTTAWDYLQSYLLCCAVDNHGWLAWRESKWFYDENEILFDDSQIIHESNLGFQMVPKSCCYRKLDYLTRQLTDEYDNINRCQNWQYGPPKFTTGAHNDALYYRGCLPTLQAYIKRFSFWIAIFGFCALFFIIVASIIGCVTFADTK